MKVIFVGNVQFSKDCLIRLIELNVDIIGVVTKKESKFNSDFADLSSIAEENSIPILFCDNINKSENVNWIRSLSPDIIFCLGWSSLIKKELLDLPKLGVLGFHPANLPYNRGRHPIIWALVLGLKKTASTFFFMDEGADTGDIVSQKEIDIDSADDASTLYSKITTISLLQIEEIVISLNEGTIERRKQNENEGNTWRKRDKRDGLIDFRMTSQMINNLIKALTKPYVGAHIYYNGNEFKVWKSSFQECKDINIEPGKILEIKNNNILVKTSDAAIWIESQEISDLVNIKDYL